VSGTLTLAPDRWRVERLEGRLGGGTLQASGSLRPAAGSVTDVDFALSARDVTLRYPADFKSRIGAELTLKGGGGALQLGGQVQLVRGLSDPDISLEEALPAPAVPPVEPSPLMHDVRLDIAVDTVHPIRIRDNLADLAVTGRLRVRGDLAAPAPY